MTVSLYSKLAGYRCPSCAALQPATDFERTRPIRGSFHGPKDHHVCAGCSEKLRLASRGHFAVSFFQIFVFLVVALIGARLVELVPGLSRPEGSNGGPNVMGFLIVAFLFVFPAVMFCHRLRRIEVVS
ncbi:MAG: hypothetical protein ABJL99_17305 [Aliishimia sp.]